MERRGSVSTPLVRRSLVAEDNCRRRFEVTKAVRSCRPMPGPRNVVAGRKTSPPFTTAATCVIRRKGSANLLCCRVAEGSNGEERAAVVVRCLRRYTLFVHAVATPEVGGGKIAVAAVNHAHAPAPPPATIAVALPRRKQGKRLRHRPASHIFLTQREVALFMPPIAIACRHLPSSLLLVGSSGRERETIGRREADTGEGISIFAAEPNNCPIWKLLYWAKTRLGDWVNIVCIYWVWAESIGSRVIIIGI